MRETLTLMTPPSMLVTSLVLRPARAVLGLELTWLVTPEMAVVTVLSTLLTVEVSEVLAVERRFSRRLEY